MSRVYKLEFSALSEQPEEFKRHYNGVVLDINTDVTLTLLLQYLEEEDYVDLLHTIRSYRRTGKISSLRESIKNNKVWMHSLT